MQPSRWQKVLTFPVFVASLGYFVDMFDLTLYAVVRQSSVASLGVSDPVATGLYLSQMQMVGLMIGGLLWGILGDKRGRLSVLFGSILLYSLGNIANAFVTSEAQYAICRFITGVGLAGELGAAVTLVSEQLPKEVRGLGTTLVATLGLSGTVVATVVGQKLAWQTSYIVGGVMGLLLLATRFQMRESKMFEDIKGGSRSAEPGVAPGDELGGRSGPTITRGNIFMLLRGGRFIKYLACIAIGMPIYFSTALLMSFAPELARGLGVVGTVTVGDALFYGAVGITIGDLLAGILSQILGRRRTAVAICLAGALTGTVLYVSGIATTPQHIYLLCGFIGLSAGYWAVLVTLAAEQFGTNLRATVATTVPNFVRGSGALIVGIFGLFRPVVSTQVLLIVLMVGCYSLAFAGLAKLRETFGRPLDFLEHD